MKHLLVTNDFPPKVGGIQNYLWELWRRLPPETTTVLTTPHRGAAAFDADQPIRVVRDRARVLLPTRALARRVDRLADELDADLVLLDPAVPLGIIGPWLERPYGVIVHGAEVTVPGRIPLSRAILGRVLRGAQIVIAAGNYPAEEARRCAGIELPTLIIPPGVDVDRFVPLADDGRDATRRRFGLDPEAPLVLGMSRLVPRKGFDVLIDASAILAERWPTLQVAIAGSGRDRARLERRARRRGAPVRFLGRVDDSDLSPLLASADVFSMLCRNRWAGLEQEGFGIVFLEAAACATPTVVGRSGGSAEAMLAGESGILVDDPRDVEEVVAALDRLLIDSTFRHSAGVRGRGWVVDEFTHARQARLLDEGLQRLGTSS